MAATIDGVRWVADELPAGMGVVYTTPGLYFIVGQKLISGTNAQFVTLSLANIAEPGTYPLGVTTTQWGGFGFVGDAAAQWSTPFTGAAGSVTVTTLTSDRIAGTFRFDATPAGGGATGTKAVTDGEFDYIVRPQGTVGEVQPHAGGAFSLSLGGATWTAATVVTLQAPGPPAIFVMTASNDRGVVTMTITEFGGEGTYELHNVQPAVTMTMVGAVSSESWGGSVTFDGKTITTNDEGSITVATADENRITGSFSAVLAPSSGSTATESITITAGSFDVGRPQP